MTLNHDRLLELGLSFAGTSVKYPFRFDLPVLYVKGKMFALLGRHGEFESVNLKASPEEAGLQRQTYPESVLPGYHMNKEHWNTVVLNGTIPDDVIVEMFIDSYQRVIARMSKKDRVGLE